MHNTLHEAAAAKDGLAKVKEFIGKGANPNELHPTYKTKPIECAAQSGSLETVKYLIEDLKVDIATNKKSLLVWATQNSSPEVINYLANPEKRLYLQFKDNTTDLHAAAAIGDLECVKALLTQHPGWSEEKTTSGQTAFDYAWIAWHIHMLNFFIEQGKDINEVIELSPDGISLTDNNAYMRYNKMNLLHYAIYKKDYDFAKVLIDKGAALIYTAGKIFLTIDANNKPIRTSYESQLSLLRYAAVNNHTELVKYMYEKRHAETAKYLHNDTNFSYRSTKPKNFLSNDVSILEIGLDGDQEELVKFIIDNVEISDERLVFFLQKAAACKTPDYFFQTLLSKISYKKCMELDFNGTLLIIPQDGVSFPLECSSSTTILHLLAYYGRLELIQWIQQEYKHPLDMNTLNSSGMTAMHMAIHGNNDETFLLYLINNGAKLNIGCSFKHCTNVHPLHMAIMLMRTAVIELLLQQKADINANCFFKKMVISSIDLAILYGANEKVLNILETNLGYPLYLKPGPQKNNYILLLAYMANLFVDEWEELYPAAIEWLLTRGLNSWISNIYSYSKWYAKIEIAFDNKDEDCELCDIYSHQFYELCKYGLAIASESITVNENHDNALLKKIIGENKQKIAAFFTKDLLDAYPDTFIVSEKQFQDLIQTNRAEAETVLKALAWFLFSLRDNDEKYTRQQINEFETLYRNLYVKFYKQPPSLLELTSYCVMKHSHELTDEAVELTKQPIENFYKSRLTFLKPPPKTANTTTQIIPSFQIAPSLPEANICNNAQKRPANRLS